MENRISEKMGVGKYIYLDELDNVIYTCDFDLVLGKIDSNYRFIPKSNMTFEQGLTAQMLLAITSIIRKKAGIGEKRAEPITEEETEDELKK